LFDQRRPSCRPDLRARVLSRTAAVKDGLQATALAARSVLDGCEHDGTLIAETDDDAIPRSLPASAGGSGCAV